MSCFYILHGDVDTRICGRTGPGLAPVKSYLDLPGGKVDLESKVGTPSREVKAIHPGVSFILSFIFLLLWDRLAITKYKKIS